MQDARQRYREEHLTCQVCLRRLTEFGTHGELHHLMGRGKGCEREENYLMLCRQCHSHLHSGGEIGDDGQRLPKLTRGMCIQVKGGDTKLLAGLRGWTDLPSSGEYSPQPLPQGFLEMRERHEGR